MTIFDKKIAKILKKKKKEYVDCWHQMGRNITKNNGKIKWRIKYFLISHFRENGKKAFMEQPRWDIYTCVVCQCNLDV